MINVWLYRALRVGLTVGMLIPVAVQASQTLQTPLEKAGYQRISKAEEMSAFYTQLVQAHPDIRREVLGQTVQGRPIEALVFSAEPAQDAGQRRLKLMIVGSQHGAAEPASGEALLVIARELAEGSLRPVRDTMDVVLIPDANPDGRDLQTRANANLVNINTDFVTLSQPESQALVTALQRFQPDVILDSHESAVLKRKSLATEGYLTDFYVQYESANNPAVPLATRTFAFDTVLPQLIARTKQQGLPANRYIGEITSIHQSIKNGGLTVQNFRNMAALNGALSFLVETRLDSGDEHFQSYRNIAERVRRQLICLHAFIEVVHEQQQAIVAEADLMRAAMATDATVLDARYVSDPEHPEVVIALRRHADGVLQQLQFPDHRKVAVGPEIPLPAYLAIINNTEVMASFLDKHQIGYQRLPAAQQVEVLANRYSASATFSEAATLLASTEKPLTLPAGTLLVDVAQPLGRLAVLLLDPRSSSNVFRYPAYAPLLVNNQEFFIYPVI